MPETPSCAPSKPCGQTSGRGFPGGVWGDPGGSWLSGGGRAWRQLRSRTGSRCEDRDTSRCCSPRFHSPGCRRGITDTPALPVANRHFSFPREPPPVLSAAQLNGTDKTRASLCSCKAHPDSSQTTMGINAPFGQTLPAAVASNTRRRRKLNQVQTSHLGHVVGIRHNEHSRGRFLVNGHDIPEQRKQELVGISLLSPRGTERSRCKGTDF